MREITTYTSKYAGRILTGTHDDSRTVTSSFVSLPSLTTSNVASPRDSQCSPLSPSVGTQADSTVLALCLGDVFRPVALIIYHDHTFTPNSDDRKSIVVMQLERLLLLIIPVKCHR